MRFHISNSLLPHLMLNIVTLLGVAFLLFAYTAWAAPSAQTSIPGVITYQGTLTDDAGQPINTSVDLTFRLYSASSGGTALWTETHSGVAVEEGLFRVGLGSQTPIPATVWENMPLYLGIQVGSESEMTPREELGAVPFARLAMTVPDDSVTGRKLSVLLGEKSCDACGNPTESLSSGWNPVKGANSDDLIEVTVTTEGGPVLVQMTERFESNPAIERWCGIEVLQQGTSIRERPVHLEGDRSNSSWDWSCSGAYVFTDLPAGTYTFRAMGWMGADSTITWTQQRQIAVFEF